tara:strand:- start:72 stop:533 length:462 start_codon:yes stop_codon:yes gene_type:complete
MKKALVKTGITLTVLLIAIQFYNPYAIKEVKSSDYDQRIDIVRANNAPSEVAKLLKTTCYDCHSFETKDYWYSDIAPASWLVSKDIMEAREKLNFSLWENYSNNEKIDFAGEIMFQIYEGKMPIDEYLLMHSEADISKAEQNKITEWINSLVE